MNNKNDHKHDTGNGDGNDDRNENDENQMSSSHSNSRMPNFTTQRRLTNQISFNTAQSHNRRYGNSRNNNAGIYAFRVTTNHSSASIIMVLVYRNTHSLTWNFTIIVFRV